MFIVFPDPEARYVCVPREGSLHRYIRVLSNIIAGHERTRISKIGSSSLTFSSETGRLPEQMLIRKALATSATLFT